VTAQRSPVFPPAEWAWLRDGARSVTVDETDLADAGWLPHALAAVSAMARLSIRREPPSGVPRPHLSPALAMTDHRFPNTGSRLLPRVKSTGRLVKFRGRVAI
jgi:hypothetical protein